MSRYFVNFYRFWYKFIIGDDWVIAVAVVWGLLAAYSLVGVALNAWYFMPLFVSFLLIWSLKRAQLKHSLQRQKRKPSRYSAQPQYVLWSLMALVVLVPYNLFYIKNNGFSLGLENLLLPIAFNCAIIVLIGLLLAPLLKKHPILSLLLAAAAALLLLQRVQSKLLILSGNIAMHYSSAVSWVVAAGCLLLTGVVIIVVIKRK